MQLIPEPFKLVLGSKSPRRQQLLRDMGYTFELRTADTDESHPADLDGVEIAETLAVKKAEALQATLADNEIVLCSDTVVWCNHEHLAKAENEEEARKMLRSLSGHSHGVITGVCLLSTGHREVFSDVVKVYFNELEEEQIDHYIQRYQPYDKAGAYGIQEWIGMIGIPKIEGSYFTVMGLPTHLIHPRLQAFKGTERRNSP